MNFIGKFLTMVFGAGSILCLIGAVAVYTQKMNFVTKKGETSKKAITRIDAEITRTKDLLNANNRAYTRWIQEYDQVVALEVDQFNRREYYRGQLELVKFGTYNGNAVEKDPIQVLERDEATKLLKINEPTGRKAVKYKNKTTDEEKSLLPQSVYAAGIKKAGDDIKKVQEEIAIDTADEIKMTAEIIGTMTAKGLRTRIKEQIQIGVDADAERIYLEDFVTNRRADAQLFVKRRDSLQVSISRLEEYYKRRGGPGN